MAKQRLGVLRHDRKKVAARAERDRRRIWVEGEGGVDVERAFVGPTIKTTVTRTLDGSFYAEACFARGKKRGRDPDSFTSHSCGTSTHKSPKKAIAKAIIRLGQVVAWRGKKRRR